MILGDANEGAGWAVIGTMGALLITFLRLVFRRNNDAVDQWKLIAETAVRDKAAAEADLETVLARERESIARIARLEVENANLRAENSRLQTSNGENP